MDAIAHPNTYAAGKVNTSSLGSLIQVCAVSVGVVVWAWPVCKSGDIGGVSYLSWREGSTVERSSSRGTIALVRQFASPQIFLKN